MMAKIDGDLNKNKIGMKYW